VTEPKTRTYIVTVAGWIAGQRRAVGEQVELSAATARYVRGVELKAAPARARRAAQAGD